MRALTWLLSVRSSHWQPPVAVLRQIVGMVLDRHSIRHQTRWSNIYSSCIIYCLGTETRP